MFTIECIDVSVVEREYGSDIVYIRFKGPDPFPKIPSSEPPELIFHTQHKYGVEYVRTVFGVEPVYVRPVDK